LKPVVNIDQQFSAYRDPTRGENVWDYYFEPVSDLSVAEVDQMDRSGLVLQEPGLQFTTTLGDQPRGLGPPGDENRDLGFARRRRVATQLFDKFVRVKPAVRSKVDAFFDAHLAGARVLGVHLRGTDWGRGANGHRIAGPRRLSEVVEPSHYYPSIDRYIAEHPVCRIFVATDQQQFLDAMKDRYGTRVAATDASRSTDQRCPAWTGSPDGYARGEEVLIDILLLARCDTLLRCASAVGEVASYFNAALEVVDVSCEPGVEPS
jgi:hypothetical protein